MKIYLNKQGNELYPWLAFQWLDVFGYDFDKHCFLIWDYVTNTWRTIHQNFCRGDDIV